MEVVTTGEAATHGVVVDVIKNVKYSFPMAIYAVDKAGDKSETVLLNVESTDPHPDTYDVAQDNSDGNFDRVTVWRRLGVTHNLFFKDYKPTGTMGFNFIEAFQSDLLQDEDKWFAVMGHYATNVRLGGPADPVPAAADGVASYYTLKVTGAVDLVAIDGTDKGLTLTDDTRIVADDGMEGHGVSTPTLMFSLKDETASGTVTITYKVVVCAVNAARDGCLATTPEREWRSVTKELRMSIVPS